MPMTTWRKRLTATLQADTWTQPDGIERTAGLQILSGQVVIETPDLGAATVTVALQGCNVGVDADDALWTDVGTAELSGADRTAWLGFDRLIAVQPYRFLRLQGRHAGGSPAVSAHAYLDGDLKR